MKVSIFFVALVSQLVSTSPIPLPTLEGLVETAAKGAANEIVKETTTKVAVVNPLLRKSHSFSSLGGSMSSKPMPISGTTRAVSAQQEVSAAAASSSAAGMSSSAPPRHHGWLDRIIDPIKGYLKVAEEDSIAAGAWDPTIRHPRGHI